MSISISPLPKIPDILRLLTFKSTWANDVIDLNEPLTGGAWDDAAKYRFPSGVVLAKNDANFLYMAIDYIDDTSDDPSTNDYFWLSFDYDKNKSISAHTDINYGLWPNQPNKIGKQYYLGPGTWTGIQNTPSPSAVRAEFGVSPWSATPHRIWKFKILLSEINVNLAIPFFTPYTNFGFRVHSTISNLTYDLPTNFFNDFTKLKRLEFSRKPVFNPADLGPVIGTVGLIPTTKIAGGRATTASNYYVAVTNAAFGGGLNLIGNRVTMTSLYGANNRRYLVEVQKAGTAGYVPLVTAWTNYVWNGTDYVLQSFSGVNGVYTLENPALDYSIDDLLVQFPTNDLPNGLTDFRITFYVGNSTAVAATQNLQLYIDNRVPIVNIDKIRHGAVEVSTCALEKLGPAPDGFTFEITAYDPEGNLLGVSFNAEAGDGQSFPLYSESYDISKGNWTGFSNKVVPAAPANWRAPFQCSYNFRIGASARTTNGYGYIGYNSAFKGLAILM